MKVKIESTQNEFHVIIPKDIIRNLGLKLNDILNLSVQGTSIVLTRPSDFDPETLEELFKDYQGTYDETIVFDDDLGKEVW